MELFLTCEGGKRFINGGKGGINHAGRTVTFRRGTRFHVSRGRNVREAVAGCGGLFNGGTRQQNYEGVWRRDGKVKIKLIQ